MMKSKSSELSDFQRDILYNLKTGKLRAITGKTIAKCFGLGDDRRVRINIRRLIAKGYPIASSVYPPYGYYMVQTEKEAREYIALIHSRLCEDAYRERDFRKAVRSLLNSKQGILL